MTLALRRHVLAIVLITLSVATVFSNTLDNPYHFDSIYRLETNSHIDRLFPVSRFFLDKQTNSSAGHIAEYRPMMTLSHAMDVQLAQRLGVERLAIHHLGNMAIHVASSILFYILLLRLLSRFVPAGPLRSLDWRGHFVCGSA